MIQIEVTPELRRVAAFWIDDEYPSDSDIEPREATDTEVEEFVVNAIDHACERVEQAAYDFDGRAVYEGVR